MTSLEALQTPNNEMLSRNPASFNIVLCDHTPENATAVADALRDCDVIAFESVGGTSFEREDLENIMNWYVDPRNDNPQADLRDWTPGFEMEVLKHFIGSGKTIKLIDIGKDDKGYESIEKTYESCDDLEAAISGTQSNDVLRNKLATLIVDLGTSSIIREPLMADQLAGIAENNPGKQIGVAIGAIHTSVYHLLSKKYETTRSFVMLPENTNTVHGQKVKFNYDSQLVRRERFGVPGAMPSGLLNRALLQLVEEVNDGRLQTTRDIDQLSDDEVFQKLQARDEIKSAFSLPEAEKA